MKILRKIPQRLLSQTCCRHFLEIEDRILINDVKSNLLTRHICFYLLPDCLVYNSPQFFTPKFTFKFQMSNSSFTKNEGSALQLPTAMTDESQMFAPVNNAYLQMHRNTASFGKPLILVLSPASLGIFSCNYTHFTGEQPLSYMHVSTQSLFDIFDLSHTYYRPSHTDPKYFHIIS